MDNDADSTLLKACESINLRNIASPGTKLVPSIDDACDLVFVGHLMAATHLEYFVTTYYKHPHRSHALFLLASLEIMHGSKANTWMKKLSRYTKRDKASLNLYQILESEMKKTPEKFA